MGTVEYVVALEQEMELVPLKRGWWVAFGGPQRPAALSVSVGARTGDEPPVERQPDETAEPMRPEPSRGGARSRTAQRSGTVPPSEPKRRRREPQPPSPRPMPDPAPSPVPDPPSTPDIPVTPRDSRGGRR